MSDTPFEWNDALAEKFAKEYRFSSSRISLEMFKADNQPKEKDIPKDWEIQCIQIDNRNYWLQNDGLYKSELFSKGCTADLLLKSRGTIYSVKRIPDQIIFFIGDNTDFGIIEKFEIKDGLLQVITNHATMFSLNNIQKVKPKVPLFTTEDGVKIFHDDYFFVVDKRYNYCECKAHNSIYYSENPFLGRFSTKDLALLFLLENKPIQLTFNDLDSLFTEEEIYPYGIFRNKLKEFFKSKINP